MTADIKPGRGGHLPLQGDGEWQEWLENTRRDMEPCEPLQEVGVGPDDKFSWRNFGTVVVRSSDGTTKAV